MYLKFDIFQKRKSVCITNTLYWQCLKTKQGQFAPLTLNSELGTRNSELMRRRLQRIWTAKIYFFFFLGTEK